jgi:oligopeptidase B
VNTPALAAPQLPQPPVAAKKSYQVASPHGTREDEYYWLRDDKRESPQMLAYVNAENAYADAMLAHVKPLETKVYNEIIGRLQQDDSTVPYLMNGYWYFRRYETGKEYPIYSRRRAAQDAPEEILLNVNELAKSHDFFEVGDIAISPDSRLMAWAEDTIGRRQYVIKVMDLATHRIFPIALPNATTRHFSTSRSIPTRCSATAFAVTGSTAPTIPRSAPTLWCGNRRTAPSIRSSPRPRTRSTC